ncbi:MAG: hypothetical protein QXR02_04375 [Acidilobaceae archaeon]
MYFRVQKLEIFTGGFLMIASSLLFIVDMPMLSLLSWILGLLIVSLAIHRLSIVYDSPAMGEFLKNGLVLSIVSFILAYMASYARLTTSSIALITLLPDVPYMIDSASIPQLILIVGVHLTLIVGFYMIAESLRILAFKSRENMYMIAGYTLLLSGILLSPVLATIATGFILLATSIYGRLSIP